MTTYSYLSNSNPSFIESLYQQFLDDPSQVDKEWATFFEGYQLATQQPALLPTPDATDNEVNIIKLIHGYRSRGHLIAKTNPIRQRRQHKADLELSYFNLSQENDTQTYESAKEIAAPTNTLTGIIDHLRNTYCGAIGAEFMYCSNEKLRQWMYKEMESCANKPHYSNNEKLDILHKLSDAINFEAFLQTKYVGKKRFSLEGLEVLIPALDCAIRTAAQHDVKECVLGMAHRGRLNVLVNTFQKSYEDVFSEFEENIKSEFLNTGGDVKYHLGKSADITTAEGYNMHLSLVPNPSHLEAVSPVLQGICQAKKRERYTNNERHILPIVIHGDAALSGQGVNYEVANLSRLEGYDNGGTIHIVTNNQVGFTANYKESRSSIYCTDLAKVTDSPVFHVNADNPEAVIHVIKMAVKIRQRFQCDVYVDILGYRKYGHNEGDEPRFTQPIMYKSLQKHKNVYELYLDTLVSERTITHADASARIKDIKQTLQTQLDMAKKTVIDKQPDMLQSSWSGYRLSTPADMVSSIKTGIKKKDLDCIIQALLSIPDSFAAFSKVKKLFDARKKLYHDNRKVDWALAEQLAWGSLLKEGHHVRVSGQDSQRGTFSHRHAALKDTESEATYIPLNHIEGATASLEIYNSLLSEYAALAYEFGYSITSPSSLVIWEAQFGDFANGAQIVIDQFLAAAEVKWQRMSGLVLLLPHGYEGQGPEHSSARLERFLQLCAEDNLYVCNITTPANFFHVLRRQLKNAFRKPLVVMSPKSLLRHPDALSPISDLNSGEFKEIIDDTTVSPNQVRKVLCCSGKLYYDLRAAQKKDDTQTAIVRLEQLYPLPKKQLAALKKRYAQATFIWVQEEPQNMGAWGFLLQQLPDWNLQCVARQASASPATGSSKIHGKTQDALITRAFDL